MIPSARVWIKVPGPPQLVTRCWKALVFCDRYGSQYGGSTDLLDLGVTLCVGGDVLDGNDKVTTEGWLTSSWSSGCRSDVGGDALRSRRCDHGCREGEESECVLHRSGIIREILWKMYVQMREDVMQMRG